MLACFLAKEHNLSAEAAIEKIRQMRPGSVDSDRQIQAIRSYIDSLAK